MGTKVKTRNSSGTIERIAKLKRSEADGTLRQPDDRRRAFRRRGVSFFGVDPSKISKAEAVADIPGGKRAGLGATRNGDAAGLPGTSTAAATGGASDARHPNGNPNPLILLAERVGFEPTEGINPQRFSRPPLSTAQPPLRIDDSTRRPI
jgi:hypothetical protein